MFKGSFVALITPMHADGSLDEKACAAFVDWQIKQGTNGVVPVGTTGESPTLSHAEHRRVVEIAIEVANHRVPVIAGAGSNSTAEAIELTRHAKQAGADAALVVTPYYNKPTQEGMYLHFTAIADAVDLPIIIYNIPPRSVIDMSVETMARKPAEDMYSTSFRSSTIWCLSASTSSRSLLSSSGAVALSTRPVTDMTATRLNSWVAISIYIAS